jgi:DNA primase
MEYLRRRGLDDAAIARFRLGFAPDTRGALKGALAREGFDEGLLIEAGLLAAPEEPGRGSYDRFRGRLMFPIADRRGRVIGFGGRLLGDGEPKYLNSPETPVFHKGRTLYGLDLALAPAREAGALVVVEGYMDAIRLHLAGHRHVVAPLGTALTEEQLEVLWRVVPEPTLCFDGDAAGVRAAARAAERALPLVRAGTGLRFAFIKPGEDPDSLAQRYRPEFLSRALADSCTLSEALWRLESGGALPTSPEARAALEKRLKEHGRRIADAAVRRHFFEDIYERLRREPRRAGRRGAGGGARPLGLHAPAAARRRVDSEDQAQLVLLAIALNHPALFDRVGEELGGLAFPDAGLDGLRQALVGFLSTAPAATRQDVEAALKDQGLADHVERIFRDPLVKAHRLVKADAPDEEVIAAWRENARALKEAALAGEAERLRQTMAGALDEESWGRAQAFLKAALEDADR